MILIFHSLMWYITFSELYVFHLGTQKLITFHPGTEPI